jgi:hypothetical protein
MLNGILEDRVYNYMINNGDEMIDTPMDIYIYINKRQIRLKDLFSIIEECSDDIILIKKIENYLWDKYICKTYFTNMNNNKMLKKVK